MLKDSEVAYLKFNSAEAVRPSLRKKKNRVVVNQFWLPISRFTSSYHTTAAVRTTRYLATIFSKPPEYMYHAHPMPLDLGPIA